MTQNVDLRPRRSPLEAARQRRGKWLPILLSLLIFTGGLICGGGLSLLAVRQQLLFGLHHPERVAGRVTRRLAFRIGLSSEQSARVEAVLRQRQQALQALRKRMQPEIETELLLLRTEVGEVLEQPQRTRWEQLFDGHCRTWFPPPPSRAAE